jgi:hypothetical protein
MSAEGRDYSLFFKFLEAYLSSGFKAIDSTDTLLVQLENVMENNNQFLYIADIIQMKVLFTSKRSLQMIGIKPEEVNPYQFMELTHPDDVQRLNLARAKLIGRAQDLFISEKGDILVSSNFKIRNSEGIYSNILIQSYLFYTSIPYKTVFFLKLHTNIDWYRKIKHGFHYYIGNNISNFRYPDDKLLCIGNIFSNREFEIIKLIEKGLSTEKIAEKLFISPLTVNTHRSNILEKTGKSHISDLIYDLKERGLL